jgi:uncharacterized protein (DUF58 family)
MSMKKIFAATGTVILIAAIAALAMLLFGKLIINDLTNISVNSKVFDSAGIAMKENALSETITVFEKKSGAVIFSFPIPPEFAVEKIDRSSDVYIVQFRKRGVASKLRN